MDYNFSYQVIGGVPTNRGYRFIQTEGKGRGRKIWIDKKKHSLNVVASKEYIIKTNRDLDSDNIKNKQYIKLEKFSLTEK